MKESKEENRKEEMGKQRTPRPSRPASPAGSAAAAARGPRAGGRRRPVHVPFASRGREVGARSTGVICFDA